MIQETQSLDWVINQHTQSLDWVIIQQKSNLVQSFLGLGLNSTEVQSHAIFLRARLDLHNFSGGTAGPALRRRLSHGGEAERPHRGGSTGVLYSDKKRNVLIGGVLLVSGTQTVRPGHD